MQAVNHAVIEFVAANLVENRGVWFATVLKTYGASPRPEGCVFAYCPGSGLTAGSLSGGCIEEDLLTELRTRQPLTAPELKIYGADPQERSRLLLPCGGTLEILLEYLPANARSLSHFRSLLSSLSRPCRVQRTVSMSSEELKVMETELRPSVRMGDEQMTHVFGPPDRILILGMGEPARYLLPILESLDFQIQICEPRAEVWEREAAAFNQVDCKHCLPDDLIRESYQDAYCAIVALAHDPRVDDLGIIAALEGQAYFVGAMGSKKTSSNRIARLEALGVTEDESRRISAPVGLDIPSKTPPEIAVSIAAELIRARSDLYERRR